MPTKRPRLTITETPAVARRLALAATQFPERANSRTDLLLALTEVAERSLVRSLPDHDERDAAKRRVVERTRSMSAATAKAMLDARETDWQHEPY